MFHIGSWRKTKVLGNGQILEGAAGGLPGEMAIRRPHAPAVVSDAEGNDQLHMGQNLDRHYESKVDS